MFAKLFCTWGRPPWKLFRGDTTQYVSHAGGGWMYRVSATLIPRFLFIVDDKMSMEDW